MLEKMYIEEIVFKRKCIYDLGYDFFKGKCFLKKL